MKSRVVALSIALGLLLSTVLGPLPLAAEATVPPTGEVRVVYFTSPLCSFCLQVQERDLPPLEAQYGESLNILRIDTTTSLGRRLFEVMWDQYNVPAERRGTPTMVINETVLVGAAEIPAQLPGLVAELLAAGGNDWPVISGLEEAIALEAELEDAAGRPLWLVRFERDLPANAFSAGLLVIMVGIGFALMRPAFWQTRRLVGVPLWVKLGVAMIGLGVALYLLGVEVAEAEAFCGPVGECNLVQQSRYAVIFGFLPLALFGAIGYATILATYLYGRWGSGRYARAMPLLSFLLSAFGFVFSIWLTYLQPFVIGATCVWCLASALTMTVTVMLNAERGWAAVKTIQKRGWKGYLRALQSGMRPLSPPSSAAVVASSTPVSARKATTRRGARQRR